jgi:hypothetical protein
LSVLLRVAERDAVQTPLEDFTAEKLLDGPVESDSSPRVDLTAPPRMIWDYYAFPGCDGVVSVAIGMALVCRRRLPSGGSTS